MELETGNAELSADAQRLLAWLRRTRLNMERKQMTFSERNKLRCESPNGFNHALHSWSLSDWFTAVAGELGEAGDIIKKLNRVRDGIPGNKETVDELRVALAEELADTEIYLDLLFQAAGIDRDAAMEAKFAKTSAKIGYSDELFTSR